MSPVVELGHLAVDILVTTAKVWIGFVFLVWIASKFGITALTTALGKIGV